MRTAVRWTLRIAAAFAALAALAFGVGWLATAGERTVPRTVADDPSLPSAVVDGVRLHVRTFGDPAAPTVVVVHGGPGNDFRYLLPLQALSDRHHVVFYDQRGSGLSERVPDDRLTLEGLYAELDGVVDRFGGGRPVALVGHSWGAMLASGYVGRHPEKVSRLVVAEPGMLTAEDAHRFLEATGNMRPPVTAEVAWLLARTWLESLRVEGPDADARADYLVGTLASSPFEGHPIAGYFCGRDLRNARMEGWRFGSRVAPALLGPAGLDGPSPRVDFVRGVERFSGKVLFLSGSCNTITGPEVQRRNLRHFRDAELVVIGGAGHTMFGEKPEESLAAVRRVLAGERVAAAPGPDGR
ncbi:MAG TPA: alpha/beta hydrolase [Anaeromyxobacteraceae bacterium]|nr:alpha/beta hydrolase [Anaeromyxobacteraceae bacterium]